MRLRNMSVVAVLSVFLMSAPPAAEARDLIEPGDHVFDAKRFADSIRETAEAIKEVANTLEILGNHLKMLARAGDIQGIWEALENVGDLPLGKTAEEHTKIFKESWDKAKANEPYWPVLHVSLSKANEDTGKAAEAVFRHQQERDNAYLEILSQEDSGLLSERQRQNMESALSAMNAIDQTELAGSQFMQEVEQQEAEFASQRIEQEKAKAGEFYGYDPYHPNEYDMEHRTVKTHSLGFMAYGK